MQVRGDGVSSGGSTKKKTTTVKKPVVTPTPAAILKSTPVGTKMATTAATNVGAPKPVTQPVSIAASPAAKAAYVAAVTAPTVTPVAPVAPVHASVSNGGGSSFAVPTATSSASKSGGGGSSFSPSPLTAAQIAQDNARKAAATEQAKRSAELAIAAKQAAARSSAINPMDVLRNTPVGQSMQQNTYENLASQMNSDGTIQSPQEILANTPIGQKMQQDAYNNTLGQAVQPAMPSGSSSGSSGGGGVGSSSGGSYSSVPATIAPSLPATPTITSGTGTQAGIGTSTGTALPGKEQNLYFDEVINSKFEYNPATDQGYLQAAAMAENAIIQSIIGRGGLYSSVAQSAVATKLTDLAIEYEKLAYENYSNERTFKMQLAQFEQTRINDAWDNAFKVLQFNTEQEQQQYENYISAEQQRFENQLNLAEFQFAQEKEAFDQNMTIAAAQRASQASYSSGQSSSAKATLEAQGADLEAQMYNNQIELSKLDQYTTQWTQGGGRANREVAKFFAAYGVQYGDNISDYRDVISGLRGSLVQKGYSISEQLVVVGEGKLAGKYVDDTLKPSAAIPAPAAQTTKIPGPYVSGPSYLNRVSISK